MTVEWLALESQTHDPVSDRGDVVAAYTRGMHDVKALLDIMARLRDPEGGCPWDLEQDFSSISPHTIEEAYEVDEAIASGDPESLRDELGDLLFQVVFQARIAEERDLFDFAGVVEAISSKLIRRHPHVFGDAASPGSAADQVQNWESIKAEERALAGRESEGTPDPFVGIPRNLPALARSSKLAGRLARLPSQATEAQIKEGVPRPPARAKLVAALGEAVGRIEESGLREVSASGPDRDEALRLVGSGLRVWVWLARELGVDPEQALRAVDDEAIAAVRESQV